MDGGELFQRPDDREEVIGPRLQAYEKQTTLRWPLITGGCGLLHDMDARQERGRGRPSGAAKRSQRARSLHQCRPEKGLLGASRNDGDSSCEARKSWRRCTAPGSSVHEMSDGAAAMQCSPG